MITKKAKNVDAYIAGYPENLQKKLQQVRGIILKLAPGAEEIISYGMPAYKLNGVLLYFAAYKNHIGFYPMPSTIEAFKKELTGYKWAKGSIQFPIGKPIPQALVKKMVAFRVKTILEKASLKAKKKGA